jgi:hypothetical protein
MLLTFTHELLKRSVHLQTTFAAETRLAEGATEQLDTVTYVPSRSSNAEYYENGGATFSDIIHTY